MNGAAAGVSRFDERAKEDLGILDPSEIEDEERRARCQPRDVRADYEFYQEQKKPTATRRAKDYARKGWHLIMVSTQLITVMPMVFEVFCG